MINFYLEDTSIYKTDCYINLSIMSNKVLKKFPKIIIYCGDEDILYEDNVRYLELLLKNKVDCKLKSFYYL